MKTISTIASLLITTSLTGGGCSQAEEDHPPGEEGYFIDQTGEFPNELDAPLDFYLEESPAIGQVSLGDDGCYFEGAPQGFDLWDTCGTDTGLPRDVKEVCEYSDSSIVTTYYSCVGSDSASGGIYRPRRHYERMRLSITCDGEQYSRWVYRWASAVAYRSCDNGAMRARRDHVYNYQADCVDGSTGMVGQFSLTGRVAMHEEWDGSGDSCSYGDRTYDARCRGEDPPMPYALDCDGSSR